MNESLLLEGLETLKKFANVTKEAIHELNQRLKEAEHRIAFLEREINK